MMDADTVKACLRQDASFVEQYLKDCLGSVPDVPQGLRAAMEYSLHAGGKRLRPVLCMAFARLFGMESAHVLPFAAAIECIHTYSLIHDDLPAMDNDDMRRGKPTSHKMFGEATAILAGDGLLTDAFFLMTANGCAIPSQRILAATALLAKGAGSGGMVGGQYLDMQYTQKPGVAFAELRAMHAMKTGALIRNACMAGAILGGADEPALSCVDLYGTSFGAAFQITDDILDAVGDAATLGKHTGRDAALGKATYVALLGLETSKELAQRETDAAVAALEGFDARADFLRGLARYVVARTQ